MAEDPQEIPDDDDHIESTTNFNDLEPGYVPMYENGEPSFIPSQNYVDFSWGSETANPTTPTSANPTTPTSNPELIPPKKKAKPTKEGALHDTMATHLAKSNKVLEKIADRLGYEKELSAKRTGVMNELLKLHLDMDDMFIVNEIICEAEQRVETFYGLSDELKHPWVMRVLEGKLYGNK
ncbi:hypothetical protein Vadar_014265 [Vaccinium darrowii]|uniref:Uncharacterized protein n=1 Tax=Vaccinium darrowii TaxID=229202 RepID=A0ACB7Z463_9ERIC|nr:hypothetical protein Vadar_014265 [Vaccinium darrowii]